MSRSCSERPSLAPQSRTTCARAAAAERRSSSTAAGRAIGSVDRERDRTRGLARPADSRTPLCLDPVGRPRNPADSRHGPFSGRSRRCWPAQREGPLSTGLDSDRLVRLATWRSSSRAGRSKSATSCGTSSTCSGELIRRNHAAGGEEHDPSPYTLPRTPVHVSPWEAQSLSCLTTREMAHHAALACRLPLSSDQWPFSRGRLPFEQRPRASVGDAAFTRGASPFIYS